MDLEMNGHIEEQEQEGQSCGWCRSAWESFTYNCFTSFNSILEELPG